MNPLPLSQAETIIKLAIAQAHTLNVTVNIALLDTGGHLITFKRMDGVLLGAIDIAIKKAYTAALFQKPTYELGQRSQLGEPLFGIESSNGGLITFAGGLPITLGKQDTDRHCIGAIGVSGSPAARLRMTTLLQRQPFDFK
ncbi:heme-binding protein [Shewanella sp. UCD-KL12]|uniref:GlcG/HbpS family heme-binding protein n=1 Tax=Shewanella sp. UCD-KL12 TaxID=1917163 RepID=UPI001C4C927E|nr:heme-binding protein [Shewanella sp. UCD-KL12]